MKTFLFSLYMGLGGGVHPIGSLHNFGVVVSNDKYQIYRSAELNERGLEELSEYLKGTNLPFPKTVIYMNHQGYAFPFYFAINEYEARETYGFAFYHSFGNPRTYLDGKNPYEPTDMIDRRLYLGHKARKYFEYGDGKITGGVDNLMVILNLVLDPKNQPVLFHCFGGMHRTGMVVMIIRLLQDTPFPEIEAEYRRFNPHLFRQKNVDFVKAFRWDQRFLDLKAKYGNDLKNF